MNLAKYNGKVVLVDENKIPQNVTSAGYKSILNQIGISFVTPHDATIKSASNHTYVHFIASSDFCRIPVQALKIVRKKVPMDLKEKTLRILDDFFEKKLLDNLSYLEMVHNVRKVKTL